MRMPADFALEIRNFKCFGPNSQRLQNIARLNIVIGRNNSGKSAVLDAVRFAIAPYDLSPHSFQHISTPQVSIQRTLADELIARHFKKTTSGGGLPGNNHYEYGKTLEGALMTVPLPESGKRDGAFTLSASYNQHAHSILSALARELPNPLQECRFARIAAERNIAAENDNPILELSPEGTGATNIVQRILNDEQLPSALIEETLRHDLNRIMGPDAHFTRIAAQRRSDGHWIVYLDELEKGRISLADSGSGMKTVLLVLINMVVMPQLEKRDPSTYVFAFEELENNLHPGLQRRLMQYVHEKLKAMDAVALVTTHAPAVIDMFAHVEDAQILYVTNDGHSSQVHLVEDTPKSHEILNDLDVRASDILQTNGIVWVEGISDVIYLRRWLVLYCQDNSIVPPVEGSEFSFIEYGGRCLSHIDFSRRTKINLAEEDVDWLIPVLSISRNSFLVMDSDRRNARTPISATKARAIPLAGGSWLTAGREIENYVPPAVATHVFGAQLTPYASASAVHVQHMRRRLDKKSAAIKAAALLTAANWKQLDLHEQMGNLLKTIGSWNPKFVRPQSQ